MQRKFEKFYVPNKEESEEIYNHLMSIIGFEDPLPLVNILTGSEDKHTNIKIGYGEDDIKRLKNYAVNFDIKCDGKHRFIKLSTILENMREIVRDRSKEEMKEIMSLAIECLKDMGINSIDIKLKDNGH